MKVSWSDVGNVQEAGQYSFRAGTIIVTSAEIAAWKQNPNAQFQLMHKHPIQGSQPIHILGRQLDDNDKKAAADSFYESSNGDSWSLARDPASGSPAVMHSPNIQSGGGISYVDVDQFLAADANGPEHQALRNLLDRQPKLPTILITCDVHPSTGEVFEKLFASIKTLGAWWHHLETVWIVKSDYTPVEIRDRLTPHIGPDDQLLIIDISGDTAEWAGVNESGSQWLDENVRVLA